MADIGNTIPSDELSEQTRRKYLEEHIPYRLVAVEGLNWFLEKLLAGERLADLSLSVGERDLTLPSLTLTNALVDAGLAHGRALCEFLGFTRSMKDDLVPVTRGNKGDDVRMKDLSLSSLQPKTACEVGPEDAVRIKGALVYFLRVASKGVAHVTIEAPATDRVKLQLATAVISRLVRKHVYQRLGKESILDRRHHPCPVAEAVAVLETSCRDAAEREPPRIDSELPRT